MLYAKQLLLTFLIVCTYTGLFAQESGSITGQVLDSTGAAVAEAKVTIRSDATGASFNASSDSAGLYRAPQLAPGVYTITAAQAGFRTLVREGIVVRVNDRLRIDLNLEVGQISETVTVQGQTCLLYTSPSPRDS